MERCDALVRLRCSAQNESRGAGGHPMGRLFRMAVATREGERGERRSRGLSLKFVVLPLTVVAAAVAIVFAAPLIYAERALPGVAIAGVNVGSLDSAAIEERLDRELTKPWSARAVVAVHDGQTWRTTNGDLAVSPDVDTAVAAALAFGKSGAPARGSMLFVVRPRSR